MVTCMCDICGKQTTQMNKYFLPTSVVWQQFYAPRPFDARYMDLCPECASKIGGFIASMVLSKECRHD